MASGGPKGKRKADTTQDDIRRALTLEKSLFGEDEHVFGRAEDSAHDSEEPAVADGVGISKGRKQQAQKQAAWVDPEDAKLEVNIGVKNRNKKLQKQQGETVISGVEYEKRLREQHRKLNPGANWTQKPKADREDGDDEDEDGEGVLRSAGTLLAKGSKTIPSGLIDMTRCKDANLHGPTQGVVQSLEFHPNGQLLMTAGLDKKLRLFQVDGIRNPSVQTVFLEDCPVHQAAFSGSGGQILAAGRRPHFYVYDITKAKVERVNGIMGHNEKSWEKFAMSPNASEPIVAFMGNQGSIPLVSLKTRQSVGTLKMPGAVRSLSFARGGQELLAGGTDGLLYLFDIRMQRCIGSQVDEGCIKGTSLAVSPDGGMFASGSDAGVCNLYKWDGLRGAAGGRSGIGKVQPRAAVAPEKAILNLTTSIDSMAFSPDGTILAIGSRLKKDALRLVHVPSRTVFSNWPSARTPLHYVHCLAFSPGGGYLAVGNAKGRALLYRLHHYSQA